MASNKSAFSFIVFSAMILNGCATGPIVARMSLPVVESGKTAMNRESDLELARAAIPANLSMIEGLVQELPGDAGLRVQAAEALYGYAYGFVEDEDASRASALYRRGLEHALRALTSIGLK